MDLILNYNRIVGNTFFGWTYHGEKISKRRIWFYRLWNLVHVTILAILCYASYHISNVHSEPVNKDDNNTPSTRKINLVELLQWVSILIVCMETLLGAIYLDIFGGKILELLFEQDYVRIDSKIERKIAKIIIIMVIVSCLFGAIIHSYSITYYFPIGYVFFLAISIYLNCNIQITILSFIAYRSLVDKVLPS